MADAPDSKSGEVYSSWGFESPLRHQFFQWLSGRRRSQPPTLVLCCLPALVQFTKIIGEWGRHADEVRLLGTPVVSQKGTPPFGGGWRGSVAGRQFWCDIYGGIFLYLDGDPGDSCRWAARTGVVGRQHAQAPWSFARDLAEKLQAAPDLAHGTQRKCACSPLPPSPLDVDGLAPVLHQHFRSPPSRLLGSGQSPQPPAPWPGPSADERSLWRWRADFEMEYRPTTSRIGSPWISDRSMASRLTC